MIEVCEVYKGGTRKKPGPRKPKLLYTYEVEVPDPEPSEIEVLRAELADLKERLDTPRT